MRTLRRNQTKFYYSTYVSSTEITDEYGNATGQYEHEYSKPVPMYANISPARGSVDADMFGLAIAYDKTIVTDDLTCPISETSILWIDTMTELDDEGNTTTPHDYVVNRVAKSLNSITYAVSRVEVGVKPNVVPGPEPENPEPPDEDEGE